MSAILIRALGPTKICLIRSFASSETRGLLGNSSFPRLTGVGLNGKVLNSITYSIMPLLQTSTDLASYDPNPSISGAANKHRIIRPRWAAALFNIWCMAPEVGVVAKGCILNSLLSERTTYPCTWLSRPAILQCFCRVCRNRSQLAL